MIAQTMTQTALRLKTKTLAGKRIEVTVPELNEGEEVELIVLRREPTPQPPAYQNAVEFLDSLPPSTLTAEDWVRIERELQEEKDAWGD